MVVKGVLDDDEIEALLTAVSPVSPFKRDDPKDAPAGVHPACFICKGACCKSIQLSNMGQPPDVTRWLAYHADNQNAEIMQFDIPCRMLCSNGMCKVEDHKPQMCRDYEVGSRPCREAIQQFSPHVYDQCREIFIEEQNKKKDKKSIL